MKDEIKEILDDLKDKCKYIEDYGYQYKRLSLEDTDLLLDYITNLQKENIKLQSLLKVKEYEYEDLCKDNRRLDNCYTQYHNEKEDYKSRIEKAIEYIEENEKEYGSLEDNEKIILNILQGVGKDER